MFDEEAIADFLEQVEGEGGARIHLQLEHALLALPSVPAAWQILAKPDVNRHAALDALWAGVSAKLPATLKMLKRKVVGFALLTTRSRQPSLLYLFDEGRDLMAMRGGWPVEELPTVGHGLAVDLGDLYRIHDGWVNIFGGEGGPLPSDDWRIRGAAPGVRGFLEVYANGSQALGFDLDEQPAGAYAMDTDDNEVEAVRDFWADLDERLAAGLRAFPDAT